MKRMARKIKDLVDITILKLFSIGHVKKLLQRRMPIMNINKSWDKKQKKALVCFLNDAFFIKSQEIGIHPKYAQMILIVSILGKHGYSIDVCDYNDIDAVKRINGSYDVIIGQGRAYDDAVSSIKHRLSILFLTENNPETVIKKYRERVEYFKARHPHVNPKESVVRKGIFSCSSIKNADAIITTTNNYNAKSLYEYCNNIYLVKVNALVNPNFTFKDINNRKKKSNFVWFGSVGIIHKGLDILIDAFAQMPDLLLNIYGISPTEVKLFNKLKVSNTILHPFVDVMSDRFINEVVAENTFVISNSCSEGMQSSIATCMMHGLIPIVSSDCGYDPHESIIMLEDYHIESVMKTIRIAANMNDDEVTRMSNSAYEYSKSSFTLERFARQMENAIKDILQNNN